jgi:hypothetical protein
VLAINIYVYIYSVDLFRYGWIHLQPVLVNENRVNSQSSIDLFGYGWIHLQAGRTKEDSVSHQSSIDRFRDGWIHLQASIVKKEDIVSGQPIWMWSDSLTPCTSKQRQSSI